MFDLVYENKNKSIKGKLQTLARAVRSWYELYDLNRPSKTLADSMHTIIILYDATRKECERKLLISFRASPHEHEIYRELYADICYDVEALRRVYRLYNEIYYSMDSDYSSEDEE